jgi:hypothetical protein
MESGGVSLSALAAAPRVRRVIRTTSARPPHFRSCQTAASIDQLVVTQGIAVSMVGKSVDAVDLIAGHPYLRRRANRAGSKKRGGYPHHDVTRSQQFGEDTQRDLG